jgi:2-polyprenyl-6-hydroxyphenyl methylase/3-demethylubiquinone-9 3-methyltransferase
LNPYRYVRNWTQYADLGLRGMSKWHDLIDWVGGYPFEVAKPEQIFEYFRNRGFQMDKLVTCAGALGCNEYIFTRNV